MNTDDLTAAVERLKLDLDCDCVGPLQAADLRTVLSALETAQADARRYRWLRRNDTEYPCVELPDSSGYRYVDGAELDAAIDAARAKVNTTEGEK